MPQVGSAHSVVAALELVKVSFAVFVVVQRQVDISEAEQFAIDRSRGSMVRVSLFQLVAAGY
jgi:hypothetical protein